MNQKGDTQKIKAPTQPPTGLRDLYPSDLNRLRFIQDAWRRTAINHGFDEIDGPTFEDADLYAVKSGEGILNECFGVFSGKNQEERAKLAAGGSAPYALRPEFTPTLARMYAARAGALPKPTKWFWTQNCFRAERPQRGRLREFYQWNCDIIGLESSEPEAQARADAECIATCVGLLESLGLTSSHVRIKVSSRTVPEAILRRELGGKDPSAETKNAFFQLLDSTSKITDFEFNLGCARLGISESRAAFIRPFFMGGSGISLSELSSLAASHAEWQPLLPLVDALKLAGCESWVSIDGAIVRGLAYYTGMVFEVHEASGAERAIAGGGRYDGLIELFGGPPTPAVGFGMGDVVLSLVLQDKGLMPTDDEIVAKLGQRPDAFVISNGTPEADAQLAPTLAALRHTTPQQSGLHARRSYKTTKNVGKLIQDASKAKARFCVIIESATHCTLKDMDGQKEDKGVALSEVAAKIRAAKPRDGR